MPSEAKRQQSVTQPSYAEASFTELSEVEVAFVAEGPMGWKITGKSHRLQLRDDADRLTFTAPLMALHTGMDLRDDHMRDYLAVAKYPDATLVVERASLRLPDAGSHSRGTARAQLTLAGKTQPITVDYTVRAFADGVAGDATMNVNMTDFGIHIPRHMGMSVSPIVAVTVHLRARVA